MRVFIGLGGNLPGAAAAFASAVGELRGIGHLVRASGLYRTAARDLFDQPQFTNAAVELETDLDAPDLLVALKRTEMALGRDPQGWRFGPRLIDLDILAIDGRGFAFAEVDVFVPHPRVVEGRCDGIRGGGAAGLDR